MNIVDNDDYLELSWANMPPNLILSVWLRMATIVSGDKMETRTNNEPMGQKQPISIHHNEICHLCHGIAVVL